MESQRKVALTLEEHDERGCVARIVVDYQARLNILNSQLIRGLAGAVNSLADNERLRVLILTGAGDRAFIGGADMNEMAALDSFSAREFISRLHEACTAIRELPVPVIARISGYCLGAGLEIAASCDLRVAADHSTFGMPEVRVGIPSVIEAAVHRTGVGRRLLRQQLGDGAPGHIAQHQGLSAGSAGDLLYGAELHKTIVQTAVN